MLVQQYAMTLERMQQLWAGSPAPVCCIQIRSIAETETRFPQRPFNSWQFPRDNIACLDERAERLKQLWQARQGLLDDSLPCLAPYYGIAEHSAFLGGTVTFAADTSYHHLQLAQLGDWRDLRLDPHNSWFEMLRASYARCHERWAEDFFIKYRGAYGPMDLAALLRGNNFYLDLYDDPHEVQALLQFCVQANQFYLDLQTEAVPAYDGGSISGFDIWLPQGGIGHLSEDASCLCAPEQYEALAAPYFCAMIEPYRMVLLHLHSLGKRTLPVFADMDKVKMIQISSDPGQPTSLDTLREYIDVLRDKIVVLEVNRQELARGAEILRELKVLLFYQAATLAEAREAIAWVRRGLRN
jgi:hypothetical protein